MELGALEQAITHAKPSTALLAAAAIHGCHPVVCIRLVDSSRHTHEQPFVPTTSNEAGAAQWQRGSPRDAVSQSLKRNQPPAGIIAMSSAVAVIRLFAWAAHFCLLDDTQGASNRV